MSLSTKPPSGMRDFLPRDLARRRYVTDIVREVYERYGFAPLETPAIEHLATLMGKYGEDERLIYRVLHRGEELTRALAKPGHTEADLADQALRYDLTVPLARVVAQYPELPRFWKRYQIAPVWRADRPGRGRFREFYQCDVDVIGTKSIVAEAEVLSALCEVLERLGFRDFTVAVNDRRVLRGLILGAGIPLEAEKTTLVAIDKLDKLGLEGVQAELTARGIDAAAGERLLGALAQAGSGPSDARLAALAEHVAGEESAAGLETLRQLLSALNASPVGPKLAITPTLARGLGYYTGAIFEVVLPDLGSSVAGGGRYDELVGIFGKRQIPAVGISLGLERILVVMEERGMYPSDLSSAPEVVLCWMDVSLGDVLATARSLRSQGLRVEVYPEAAKLGKQLQYAANEAKASFAAILGATELETGSITLKNFADGQQRNLACGEVAHALRGLRTDPEPGPSSP